MSESIRNGQWQRPIHGPVYSRQTDHKGLPLRGGVGWQSQGGTSKGHPAQALPLSLNVQLPSQEWRCRKAFLCGVFALFADPRSEGNGSVGASLLLRSNNEVLHRYDLQCGRHYVDARDLDAGMRLSGDGISLEPMDRLDLDGSSVRLDLLSVDIPSGAHPKVLTFQDHGTPASFVIFDVLFEGEEIKICPFRGHRNNVSLAELGSVLRLRDRARFDQALDQLEAGIDDVQSDIDEARGLALAFLSVTCAAMLELGAERSMHRSVLEIAREVDAISDTEHLKAYCLKRAIELTESVITRGGSSGDALIDKALRMIERNYARDLSDTEIALDLGLSTSHFRFLFRQATGQPFHKYLISLRLEKAREMLLSGKLHVSEVAGTVGFSSAAHFSRAFHKRFQVSPSAWRESIR